MTTEPAIIAPCIWLDDQAEEAARVYAATIPSSAVTAVVRYPAGLDNPAGKPRGSVMTVELDLGGCPFTILNGGPAFAPNPSISFFAHAGSIQEIDRMATALAAGGSYLMELADYPWSERYAWVRDRFGVSWQVMHTEDADTRPGIVPCLMFSGPAHGRAEEALVAYARSFPGGRIDTLVRYDPDEGPDGTIKHGRTSLGDCQIAAMDSHIDHNAPFTEAVSLQIHCHGQGEVDRFWLALSAGGRPGPCGWLTDRFGVSWQVVPAELLTMLRAGDAAGPGYGRLFEALLGMTRLDVAALRTAYEGP